MFGIDKMRFRVERLLHTKLSICVRGFVLSFFLKAFPGQECIKELKFIFMNTLYSEAYVLLETLYFTFFGRSLCNRPQK